jgi:hypothetical protein
VRYSSCDGVRSECPVCPYFDECDIAETFYRSKDDNILGFRCSECGKSIDNDDDRQSYIIGNMCVDCLMANSRDMDERDKCFNCEHFGPYGCKAGGNCNDSYACVGDDDSSGHSEYECWESQWKDYRDAVWEDDW